MASHCVVEFLPGGATQERQDTLARKDERDASYQLVDSFTADSRLCHVPSRYVRWLDGESEPAAVGRLAALRATGHGVDHSQWQAASWIR